MMTCREAARAASQALDGPLPLRRRLGLALHLSMCRACARYSREIRTLHRLLQEWAGRPDAPGETLDARLPAGDRDRIRRALLEAAGSGA